MATGHPARRRLPTGGVEMLVRSAAGGLLLRPWFDAAALRLLTQWFFPLSRAWAAGLAAEGSVEHFLAALPCGRMYRRFLPSILKRLDARQAAMDVACARWEEGFFGGGPARAQLETDRLRAASVLMNQRSSFVPLHLETRLPAIAWDVEPIASVERRHRRRLARPEAAFAIRGDASDIEASRGFLTSVGVEGWVRFPAPVPAARGLAWARVSTPALVDSAAPARPTLIFCHGISMETEFTGDGRNPLTPLVRAGVRVIRPEGPWHGRRRLPGAYGGEPVLARGPGGLLDYFHAHVVEIARLVAWARATRGGPVAIGGVSLGALTAQLAAVAAHHWPAEMRPDALLLVAPSNSLTAVTFEGSLTRALGVPDALNAEGWTVERINTWRSLLEPVGTPAVPPERIVVVLGETDDVTLAAGGEALARNWKVPEPNVFRSPAGHFSASLGLSRNIAPFRRLLEIVGL